MGLPGQANNEAHTPDKTCISGLQFPASWTSHCGPGQALCFSSPGWLHGRQEGMVLLSQTGSQESRKACTSQNCVRSPEARVLSYSWTLLVNCQLCDPGQVTLHPGPRFLRLNNKIILCFWAATDPPPPKFSKHRTKGMGNHFFWGFL